MRLFVLLAIGLVAGLIARFVLPGGRTIGVVLAAVLGLAGAALAPWLDGRFGWGLGDRPAAMGAAALGGLVAVGLLGLAKRLGGPSR